MYPEAAYFGNFIVSTDISPARDITKNNKIGKLFKIDDIDKLAEILGSLIENESYLIENIPKVEKYCEDNYLWKNIVAKLYKEILIRWKV